MSLVECRFGLIFQGTISLLRVVIVSLYTTKRQSQRNFEAIFNLESLNLMFVQTVKTKIISHWATQVESRWRTWFSPPTVTPAPPGGIPHLSGRKDEMSYVCEPNRKESSKSLCPSHLFALYVWVPCLRPIATSIVYFPP